MASNLQAFTRWITWTLICTGEVHNLLGENGAGRSALMKILSGFFPRDSGRIIFQGEDIGHLEPESAPRSVQSEGGKRATAVRYGQERIDLASEVGAPTVVVIPAPAGRTRPTEEPRVESKWEAAHKGEWENAVDSVKSAAAYGAERRVLSAVEPINRCETFLVPNLDEGIRLLDDVGRDNLKLPPGTREEAALPTAVPCARDLAASVHVSDSSRWALGHGHTDFAALLKALKGISHGGLRALELVPPGSDPLLAMQMPKRLLVPDICTKRSINYLRSANKAALCISTIKQDVQCKTGWPAIGSWVYSRPVCRISKDRFACKPLSTMV